MSHWISSNSKLLVITCETKETSWGVIFSIELPFEIECLTQRGKVIFEIGSYYLLVAYLSAQKLIVVCNYIGKLQS